MKKGDYLAQLLDSLISSKKKYSIYCYSLQETIQFLQKVINSMQNYVLFKAGI